MADSVEHEVSSTTPLFSEEVHHYQAEAEPDSELDKPKQDLFSVDDIVDLVGGAQDALDRHIAEDSAPHEFTETPTAPAKDPVTLPESFHVTEPEPVSVPEVKEPEPEPEVETAIPDSTSLSFLPETPLIAEEPEVVAPKVEPESTKIVPEPQAAPEPEPAPASDALPVAEPRTAAPAPAEAAEQPAVTEEPPAPASCLLHGWKLNLDSRDVPSPSKAQPHPLMQFPTVVDLLYWRDVKTTGVVFGAALLLLLSLMVCSIVSVCSYIGLALLSVTICFRIYKGILQAIQKSDEGHPFKQYLDQEVALSEDMVHKYSDMVLAKLNKTLGELRRLFLVEDLVDSIKFAVLMWILTYVGALFNGLTLIILGLIAVFSCPIVYEKHQAQIDHYLALVNNKVKDVVGKVQEKVPGMKRKTE
ncbi:reticulon-3-like isoform X5 [Dicentrarchus labrax]|uniref:reticulon-3-like isoform X5 n=1 Tax=Dicentrarchus labrax TaxID=13489 RepID=UPI0021F5C333|nr:reticulon-3-like isoform X5 [Dicentrarchus labrax]